MKSRFKYIVLVPLNSTMKHFSKIAVILILLIGFTGWGQAGAQSFVDQDGVTKNQLVNGKKEGPWVIFAKMRNLKGYKPDDKYEEGDYKSNRKIGVWTRYYATGNKLSEITYKNGRPSGDYTTYYDEPGKVEEKGTQKGRALTGNFERYHPNGQLAQKKTFNQDGKSEGLQQYITEQGVVELEFTTSNGVETGTATRRWPNGDIKEIITYGDGGVVTERNQKDRVNPPLKIVEKPTKESKKVEAGTVNIDGKEKTVYKIEDGERKVYNENKDIWMDGEFKNNRLWNGKLYVYDEDGLLEKIEIYKNGKYAGNGVLE